MKKQTLGMLALAAVIGLTEAPAFAQIGGMPSMGGMGGGAPPRRKLKRNSTPALSPALNMVPGVTTSFEGQFLLRTVPQERAIKTSADVGRRLDGLQNQFTEQEMQIKSGLGKTGHSTSFMNYHGFFPGRRR